MRDRHEASMADQQGIVTTGLAVWGAVLSTVLGVRTLWRDRQDRGRLRVSCGLAYLGDPDDGGLVQKLSLVVRIETSGVNR